METDKLVVNRDELNQKRRRIKRIKAFIITTIVILLILPTILCIFLFFKIDKLQDEVNVLKVVHKEAYNNTKKKVSAINKTIVHATEKPIKVEESSDIKPDSKESVPMEEKSTQIEEKKESKSAKVYLTFDDGPSKYTETILDILKENQIKATFFVVGKTDDYSKSMYKRIIEEGHTLGMHSYSHQYKKLYKSVKVFKEDFNLISNLIYEITGYRPEYYRFPGGSSNVVSNVEMSEFIQYLNQKNITYFDWNVVNGDATNEEIQPDGLISNVLSGIENKKESVVLMHDISTKENTVKALPDLINELKKKDLDILPIDKTTVPIQHIKADSIKN